MSAWQLIIRDVAINLSLKRMTMFQVLKKQGEWETRRTSSPPRLLLTAETSSGGGTRDGRADFVLGWLQPCRDQRLPRLSCKEESALFSSHSDHLKAASELSSLNLTFCFPHTILLSATESSNLRKHTKSPKEKHWPKFCPLAESTRGWAEVVSR